MREDERGSSLGLGNTAVLDQLLPIIFFSFAGRKRRNGLHQHLFRHVQKEEGFVGVAGTR